MGPDLVVRGWEFFGTDEAPYNLSAPPDRHDRGIVHDPDGFREIFRQYPEVRFISANELVGYLHAGNLGFLDTGDNSLEISLGYGDHYCAHFRDHTSRWKLEVADWVLQKREATGTLTIDGRSRELKIRAGEPITIEVPGEREYTRLNLTFKP